MLRMSRIPAVALLQVLLAAGCAHRQGPFRLASPGNRIILIPPDDKDLSVTRAALRIGPRVVVTRDAIGSTTGPELFAWTVELEKQGCIPANGALALSQSVIDTLPLDLAKRSQLLQGRGDLKDFNSLQVVSSIYKGGAPASAGEITSISQGGSPNSLGVDLKDTHTATGYEIAWYDLLPRETGDPGYRVLPRSAEVHIDGAVEHPAVPATSRFQSDPQARWHQLFMMTKVSENDFDFVVLSARTSAELQADVIAFQRDSEAFLKAADPVSYTLLPHGTGINAYVRVTINGVSVDLMRGSLVRHALLQESADVRTVLQRLSIRKLHNGKLYPVEFDRKSDQILSLPLEGGEEIDW